MCGTNDIGIQPVVNQQQPPRQSLFSIVKPITGRILCQFYRSNCQSAKQQSVKLRRRSQSLPHGIGLNSESVAGYLHYDAMRKLVQPCRERQTDHIFTPDHSDFDTFPVRGFDHHRADPTIQKVHGIDSAAFLLQAYRVFEAHQFQVGIQETVFLVRNSQQQSIPYWLSVCDSNFRV